MTSQLLTCGTRPTVYFDSRLGLNWNNGESFLPDVYTFFETTRLFSTLLRSTLTEECVLMRKSGHKKNNGKVMNYAGGGLKEKRS